MDNENGKLLVQAGKSALNIILKQPAKTVLFTKGLLPARIHSTDLPAPDELLIKKRASICFQTALSGL